MMIHITSPLLRYATAQLVAVVIAGCAQVREPPALPAIQQALSQAASPPAPRPQPQQSPEPSPMALKPSLDMQTALSKAEPRFSLAVNNAPAQQVFLGIASGSRYSMLLHPEVSGSISVNLKNVTVPEAMAALRDLYGYEYRIEGERITVFPLTAQTRIYTIPYPAALRQGKSELRVSSGSIADSSSQTAPPGQMGTTAGMTAGQLDSSRVVTNSQTDFWSELKSSIALLLGCGEAATGGCAGGRSVVVSPQTGLLAVRALPTEHRLVSEYLRAARLSSERQVMIEAKILEVTLNEAAQSGINWAWFYHGNSLSKGTDARHFTLPKSVPQPNTNMGELLGAGLPASGGAIAGRDTNAGLFGLALQATNFTALIDFLQTQGSVQVLSSPRIAAINNQKAVLKVGNDEFFVTGITTNTTTSGGNTTTSPTLTVQPFFSGIALDVTPRIDEADNIILHVHPSVSVVNTNEKTIDLGNLGKYVLPLAASSTSETDSVVRLKDGQIAVIGGLMKHASQDGSSSVPGMGEVPLVGGLFKNTAARRLKQELVILLKPTIIREPGDWQAVAAETESRLDALQP